MESSVPDVAEPPQQILLMLLEVFRQAPDGSTLMIMLGMLLLLVASALISGSEVAFFSLSAKEIGALNTDHAQESSRIFNLLSRPRYLLATILIANNLVNVAIVVLSYFLFKALFNFDDYPILGYSIQIGGLTFVLVLFGEVLPKVYATKYNIRMALMMSRPLTVMRSLFKPVSWGLVKSGIYIEGRLKKNGNSDFDPEELEKAIELTSEGHPASADEIKMLKGIVKFGNIQVKQIMRPRMDMIALDEETEYQDLIEIIREAGYSRIPVYKESLDNIVGILYVKDLLEFLDREDQFRWQALIRPAQFVPETKKIDDLLKEMQEKRVHLVIAVDEYGGTAGLVTLEDILEEVIGEIRDEYDLQDEIEYEKIDRYNYLFEGKTLIHDICKVMNLREDVFDEVRGESDSLAGLVLELAGRIPEPGEETRYNKFNFTVVSLGANRIEKVKVTIDEQFEEE